MGLINITKERKEISEWLTSIGCAESDQRLILDKLMADPGAHVRYLNNARRSRAETKH